MKATCSVETCDRPVLARGYCSMHYRRWHAHGDPLGMAPPPDLTIPVATRFWSKVDLSNPDGCWPWTASLRHQYGEVWVDGTKQYSHRVAWQLVHGRDLTPDEVVRHACDNPLCVRPDHLVLGTQIDNIQDMAVRGRWRNQFTAGPNNDPSAWADRRARRRAWPADREMESES